MWQDWGNVVIRIIMCRILILGRINRILSVYSNLFNTIYFCNKPDSIEIYLTF